MVTVLIPNYNHAFYLYKRIDSVLNQTYQDFEVVILDDCSDDNSVEIIESYRSHPKVRQIVYNDENSGSTFKQWKKGLDLIRSEWVWIAESDDFADLHFLEYSILKIQEYHNVALVYSSSFEVDSDDKILKRNDWADNVLLDKSRIDRFNNGQIEVKRYFFCRNIIPNASAVLFRREYVDENILNLMTGMRFAGDWLFWSSIVSQGNVCFLSKELNFFRCHSNSTREVQNLVLERKRFEECLFIIKFLKKKYKLDWNKKGHYWLIDEWKWKFSSKNSFLWELLYLSKFPIRYKVEILTRIMVDKIMYS